MLPRIIFVIIVAFAVGALGAYFLTMMPRNAVVQSGTPDIGGPFELTAHDGRTVTQESFKGKYSLVTFGYTYCPDVCPATLNIVTEAMNKLGDKAKQITPLMITVDPERDTVKQMANYISSFHPSFVGLTGTEEQVKKAAKGFRVYYAKSGEGEGYLMDHSTFTYLMDPEGRYVTHFGYGISADDMAARIEEILNSTEA